MVSWFLTICITFWQLLELSPTPLCEIQVLGARFLNWVVRFVLWVLILSLEHFGLRQALMKHLLLLEVKHLSRRCPRAPNHVVSLRKVCEGRLHLRKERSKLVDQRMWLKETRLGVDLVSNSSFLNRDVGITGLVILNFSKQIIVSPLVDFLLYLLVLLCFRIISCGVLYCLVDIMYIHLWISLGAHCIYSVN
jgi:hypothetical protein